MLAELLAAPDRLVGMAADPEVLDEARSIVEEAAADAVRLGGWTGDDPLRLSKGPVTWLLRCPRRAVADPDADGRAGNPDDRAIGLLVDAGAKLAALRPAQPVTVDAALAFLAATGDETVRDHLDLLAPPPAGPTPDGDGDGAGTACPGARPPGRAAAAPDRGVVAETGVGGRAAAAGEPARSPSAPAEALLTEAGARLEVLLAGWPEIDGAWWPRVEEPARVRLAGGAIVVSGRLDLLVGGPPTDRPALVVEIKAGRWHDAVRSDGHLYGLLLGLRDGVPPAAVLSLAAGDGATQLEPLRTEVLRHAAERVAEALRVAAHLAAGEAPTAHPGTYCTYCPLRATCPEAQAAAA